MEKRYTHILWDFNGTVYDDADASRCATNILLRNRGLDQIETLDMMRARFCFPVKSYYSDLGFDYSLEQYEDIASEWSKLYNELSVSSGFCPGVDDVIRKLKKLDYTQIILSACEYKSLVSKLEVLGIDREFAGVLGTDNVNAHSKAQIAEAWRDDYPDAVALMIGDTEHDFEVANLVGADCILYSGGYYNRGRLEKCGCPVIDSFDNIWKYII